MSETGKKLSQGVDAAAADAADFRGTSARHGEKHALIHATQHWEELCQQRDVAGQDFREFLAGQRQQVFAKSIDGAVDSLIRDGLLFVAVSAQDQFVAIEAFGEVMHQGRFADA